MPLSLVTYNILADGYIRPEWYPRTPDGWLTPALRHPALLDALLALNADILALQEVERPMFGALRSRLAPHGYQGHFEPRGAGKPDGCATFVRQRAVTDIGWERLDDPDAGADQSAAGQLALITRVGLGRRTLGVANTHLKWAPPGTPRDAHPGARQLDALVAYCQRRPWDGWAVCGDLNCVPGSAVLDGLRAAGFSDSHRGAQTPTCTANGHPRKLDHIFVSEALEAAAGPIAAIQADTPLPSAVHPSDHLPVAALLDWR